MSPKRGNGSTASKHMSPKPPFSSIAETTPTKCDTYIYTNCPRHGNGEPKRPEQLKRRQGNRCVYCGKSKAGDEEVLGPACEKRECQEKRWAESKLTDKQEYVLKATADGLKEKQIADEMHIKIGGVKAHKTAIAKKLGVPRDRALFVRCYMERQKYLPKGYSSKGRSPKKHLSPRKL